MIVTTEFIDDRVHLSKGTSVPRRTAALTGILVAVPTPFTADASAVDEAAIATLVDRLVNAGVHGLVPCGTTGEFTTLSPAEHRRVTELYVQAVAGRVPVVAGVGSLSTAGAIELAQHAEQVGADAVMVVPPFYDALDLRSLHAFLEDVAGAITIPMLYYHVPGATGVQLTAAEIAGLGAIEGVDFLKDTSGDAVSQMDLLVNHGDQITVFNGWDTLTFLGIAAGAEAAVWGAASVVPELAVEFWHVLAELGDLVLAREQWRHLWAISDFLESVNYAAGIEAGLELVGCPVGPARRPIQPLADADRARFAEILAAAGVPVPGR